MAGLEAKNLVKAMDANKTKALEPGDPGYAAQFTGNGKYAHKIKTVAPVKKAVARKKKPVASSTGNAAMDKYIQYDKNLKRKGVLRNAWDEITK